MRLRSRQCIDKCLIVSTLCTVIAAMTPFSGKVSALEEVGDGGKTGRLVVLVRGG